MGFKNLNFKFQYFPGSVYTVHPVYSNQCFDVVKGDITDSL